MTDTSYHTQEAYACELPDHTDVYQLQIHLAQDPEPQTIKLTELQQWLGADEFQRLETSLARYLGKVKTTASTPAPATVNDPIQPALTARETEVMQLIARGCRSQEMGELLEISTHTVTAHIKNLYRKLNVGSRSEAIFEAFQQGLISH